MPAAVMHRRETVAVVVAAVDIATAGIEIFWSRWPDPKFRDGGTPSLPRLPAR
jgi:hypothetical protein